jgi:hypothetical protein
MRALLSSVSLTRVFGPLLSEVSSRPPPLSPIAQPTAGPEVVAGPSLPAELGPALLAPLGSTPLAWSRHRPATSTWPPAPPWSFHRPTVNLPQATDGLNMDRLLIRFALGSQSSTKETLEPDVTAHPTYHNTSLFPLH